MTIHDIRQWHRKVSELLRQQRIYEAIELLSQHTSERFQSKIDEVRFTYDNILSYTGKGIIDPMSATIYSKLVVSLFELSDLINLYLISLTGSKIASIKAEFDKQSMREGEDLSENLIGLAFDNELNEILRGASLFNDESESESARNHRQAISRSFVNLWLTDKFTEHDEEVIARIFNSSSIPWFEKSMIVSALTLGTIRVFDYRRINILFDLYDHPEVQISQRALFGCILSIMLYDKRFYYYPSLMEKINSFKNRQDFKEDALSLLIQFYRSQDTEKVSRKLREEFIPQVIKFNQDLNDKLDLEKLLQSGDSPDKNPEWEKYFDNQPGLARKIEELTNMQLEGVDIFLSAFSMLKSFSFFNDIPNWFMPFYKENYAIQQSLKDDSEEFKNTFLKGIDLSVYMCNSDKFSFVFNLKHMPDAQRNLMTQMFDSESEQLAEFKNEELSDPALARKRITIQYIQDLYRFFKLHPLHNEIGDIFNQRVKIHESVIMTELITDSNFYRSIANFYFDNDHYTEALDLFTYLIDKGETNAELYEKSGYCHQLMSNYHDAINLYKRADLFDTNHSWLLRKQAQCYLALENTESALHCFLELSTSEPDNKKLNASIGTCYLDMDQPENAIEYFYRIEFANPGSFAAMRPVAWCLFLLKRLDEATDYYNQLINEEPNTFDYMNAGHVAFCHKDKLKAIELYQNSIDTREGDKKSFVKGFNKDRKYLISNGVEASEAALMLDYMRFGK